MARDATMDAVRALGDVVNEHQKTIELLRETVGKFWETLQAAGEQFESQAGFNRSAQDAHTVHAGMLIVFRAAIAILASEASTRALERLEALLKSPLDTVRDIDPASPLEKQVQLAADGLKYDLYRLQE
jgi:hypothetical protein